MSKFHLSKAIFIIIMLLAVGISSLLIGAKYHHQIKSTWKQLQANQWPRYPEKKQKPDLRAEHMKHPQQLVISQHLNYFTALKKKILVGGHLPAMVSIAAGSFDMGCHYAPCPQDELPQKNIRINAFEIATTEVTYEAWDMCIADGGCTIMPGDFGWGRGNHPLLNISWNQFTEQFLPWLNSHSQGGYRLPTEAEWEYAARGGLSEKRMSWGNEAPTCHTGDKTGARFGSKPYWKGAKSECPQDSTLAVGSYAPNAWGLYDIHGNVAEFTSDCGNLIRSFTPTLTQMDALESEKCLTKIRKGGAWTSPSSILSVSLHRAYSANTPFDRVGFRLARSIN